MVSKLSMISDSCIASYLPSFHDNSFGMTASKYYYSRSGLVHLLAAFDTHYSVFEITPNFCTVPQILLMVISKPIYRGEKKNDGMPFQLTNFVSHAEIMIESDYPKIRNGETKAKNTVNTPDKDERVYILYTSWKKVLSA